MSVERTKSFVSSLCGVGAACAAARAAEGPGKGRFCCRSAASLWQTCTSNHPACLGQVQQQHGPASGEQAQQQALDQQQASRRSSRHGPATGKQAMAQQQVSRHGAATGEQAWRGNRRAGTAQQQVRRCWHVLVPAQAPAHSPPSCSPQTARDRPHPPGRQWRPPGGRGESARDSSNEGCQGQHE